MEPGINGRENVGVTDRRGEAANLQFELARINAVGAVDRQHQFQVDSAI